MAVASAMTPSTLVDVENKAIDNKPKSNSVAAWCSTNWKAILTEFISTNCLIIFGCMSCIPIDGLTEQSPLYAPIGFGLTVMFNVQIFGHLSGAHMNPAVTLAAVISGKTSIILGIFYCIVQILGATSGYGILMSVAPNDIAARGICMTLPHPGLNSIQAMFIEIILTGILSLIVCSLWDPMHEHKGAIPIMFGLAIIGLSIAGGPLTGASMNPARSFGPTIWTGMWTVHWVYWAGPLIGAALTASFYRLVFLKKELKTC